MFNALEALHHSFLIWVNNYKTELVSAKGGVHVLPSPTVLPASGKGVLHGRGRPDGRVKRARVYYTASQDWFRGELGSYVRGVAVASVRVLSTLSC